MVAALHLHPFLMSRRFLKPGKRPVLGRGDGNDGGEQNEPMHVNYVIMWSRMAALADQLKSCGVVGAGGAGFPAWVKAQSEVEYLLANGAESEPLLHKDYELMKHFAPGMVKGTKLMRPATKARQAPE